MNRLIFPGRPESDDSLPSTSLGFVKKIVAVDADCRVGCVNGDNKVSLSIRQGAVCVAIELNPEEAKNIAAALIGGA